MSVKSGSQVGPYEVRDRIGAGGMGEVWLGHDPKLKRDAALKFLPEEFARDRERLARFRREAQVLASLNHPNIAQIYGLHEEPGQPVCLAMEYVPGETLAERISKHGAVPLDESLDIAKQICDALEHAHEKSVIHRDLKPANVKLTPEGKVKVLDFGLAKAFSGEGAALSQPSHQSAYLDSQSPPVAPPLAEPLTLSPTLPGVILGTAAYMSPEQAKGKTVDKRTDIWAHGCVLYELLTGQPAFDGETVTEVLGSVLKSEPDWSALPAEIPPSLRTLLRRCLTKGLTNRPRDAGDIRIQIQEVRAASAPAISTTSSAPAALPRHWLVLTAVACFTVAVLTAVAVWLLRPSPAPLTRPVERLTSALPANTTFVTSLAGALAISPDGSRIVYAGQGPGVSPRLYLRAMDSLDAVPLAGTEGGVAPFFSPDGEWIAYISGTSLKKVAVSGGASLTLASISGNFRGGTWGTDNTIVFTPNATSGLVRVPAAGGEPQPLTTLQQGELSHRWPQFLPDAKSMLFTIGTTGNFDEAQIAVQKLDGGERKVVIRGGTHARYVSSGHIVFYRANTLMAAPFDLGTLETRGSPSPVVELVRGDLSQGTAFFSVSDSGSLVYLSGATQSVNQTMVWVNRQGTATPLSAPARPYRAPRLSPDGRLVSVGIGTDVWVYDIQRDTLTRTTFERNNAVYSAIWTPDSRRIVFPSDRAGPLNIFWKPVDGSSPEERLTTSSNGQRTGSFSPDGRVLLYTEVDPKTASDLWVMSLEDRKPRPFLQTPFSESSGSFSPDGRWVAYASNESGRLEIYVRPFPGPGGKWQISTEGGSELAWNPLGRELFYRTGAQKERMLVVEYETQPTFTWSAEKT